MSTHCSVIPDYQRVPEWAARDWELALKKGESYGSEFCESPVGPLALRTP
jgi:hypothetical protein